MSATDKAPWESTRRNAGRGLLRKLITWSIVLGGLAALGYGLRPKPIEVELAVVSRGPLMVHVVEEGKTRVRNRYIVSAPLSGQMSRVTLRAGDDVKGGETVITTLQPAAPPLLDERAKTQAEARVRVADAARMQADQALEMAHTADKFAQQNWQRVRDLGKGSVSETDRDAAERDASMRQQEVRAGEFALKVAEFELAQAKAALLQIASPAPEGSVIEVRAPVSGKVLRVMQESAMVVTPGAAILEIGDTSDIEIEAEILSRDAITISEGAQVTVEQWGGDEPLKARVRRVEPAAFTKVSALGVEEQRVIVRSDLIDPPAAARGLGDRYRVEVRVTVWHSADALLIPAGALFRQGNEWRTFVFSGDGKSVSTKLEVGHTDGRQTEVLSGLTAGVRVLLHPPDTVTDGSEVVPRKVE